MAPSISPTAWSSVTNTWYSGGGLRNKHEAFVTYGFAPVVVNAPSESW